MIRLGPILAIGLIAIAVGFCLVTSSDIGLAAAQPAAPTIQHNVLVDQQTFDLDVQPTSGAPAIDQSQAMTVAATHISPAAEPTGIQAQYALITLRDTVGQVAGGVDARPVWLVTFEGVAYVPSGSSATVCACSVAYQRPNTVVALDAQTAGLVAVIGAAN